MNALLQSGIKRGISYISEIWFLILSVFVALSTIGNMLAGDLYTVNQITGLASILLITLLIYLIIKKASWIHFYLGLLFTIGSTLTYLAVLSEYREFPLGTEPGALSLITGGSLLCGTSFLLAIRMMIKGIHKIFTN